MASASTSLHLRRVVRALVPRCRSISLDADDPARFLSPYGAGAFATGNSMKLPLSPLSETLMVARL
jgi:hypothetical protein